jgi:hypothetical protein
MISLTSGSGSLWPKNMWIRIRIRIRNTASPQSGYVDEKYQAYLLSIRVHVVLISVAEPEPRDKEPKLNCLLEPETKLRIAAPAPFYIKDLKKKHCC